MEEFIEKCKAKDLIRWTIVDLNGNAKTKIIPGSMCGSFVRAGGREMCSAIFSLSCSSFDPEIPWVIENGYPDCAVLPDPDTLHDVTWSNCTGRIGQVICSTKWRSGQPVQFDARNAAMTQIQKLNEMGFNLYSAFEPEWRLFVKTDPCEYSWQEQTVEPYSSTIVHKYEQLLYDIYSALSSAGLSVEALHTEFGRGQMEITMAPKWGLRAPDEAFLYKGIVKQVAMNHGYIASFISTPYQSETGNGLHYNHSLWSADKASNVFHDPSQQKGMSQIMQHWVAGLILHSRSIAALTSPTVNCYRRLHKPFTPSYADWELWSRNATYRVKVSKSSQGGTYVENRAPSSAANPYIVLAATVAAGIDGIQRRLELPPGGFRDVRLPANMKEGIEALTEDTVITEALGTELIEFYTEIKNKFDRKRVENRYDADEEQLCWERQSYLEFL